MDAINAVVRYEKPKWRQCRACSALYEIDRKWHFLLQDALDVSFTGLEYYVKQAPCGVEVMRRNSESSQYHDETPRRRVRRTPSHDLERHHSNDIKVARSLDGVENVPTSPYSQASFQYLGPHGASSTPSPTRSVQPVSPHRSVSYHGFQRSFSQPVGSTGEMSPCSPFPHPVVSPSHYQSSSPMHVSPALSPSALPSTPSCATPSSVTYTLSRGPGSMSPRGSGLKTPEFYAGMPDASQLSPADPNFTVPYSSEPFSNPRDQFVYSGGSPSQGGTIHHLGYNTSHRTQSLQNPALFTNQLSPGRNQPTGNALNPHGSVSVSRNHGVANRGDKSPGFPVSSDLIETGKLRPLVIGYYNGEIETLKANYREKLQELFFLQSGGSMMDFLIWKKRPSPQFLQFLNSNRLDDTSGMNPSLTAMTVSPSSRLPQSFMWPQQQADASNAGVTDLTALQRQVHEQAGLDPRKSVPGNFNANSNYNPQISDGIAPNVSPFTGNQPLSRTNVVSNPPPFSRSMSLPNPPLEMHVPPGHGTNHFESNHAAVGTVAKSHVSGVSAVQSGVPSQTISNGPTVHPHGARSTRGQSLSSMLEQSFSSTEDIAVEAKKEAEVLKRVSELRKEGLWSLTRLPKVKESDRCKAHWDYLLEEMTWLATDFVQERKWKRGICKKVHVKM